ncbi:B12-binding domain-containing radical SAM protein [Candidatus Woesearchaeota archaeon]|nr:B12-binding domain-containing radical SAM protein [Candidatus Woesearchaeota archaeon]
MKAILISPNIVTQKGDFFGSGIPYMPFTVAYVAAFLREKKHDVVVIDAFGEDPTKVTEEHGHFIQGITAKEIKERIALENKKSQTDLIVISAERVIEHNAILNIIEEIRKEEKNIPIAIIENTQAVSAYALKHVFEEFFEKGANIIVTGEPEHRVEKILLTINRENKKEQEKALAEVDGIIIKNNTDGEITKKEKKEYLQTPTLDALPFPAWDLFPLEKYWELGYAHAPLTKNKYLPLLTSRGCPYPCGFCVVPTTNERKWRSRTAKNVVDEMEYLIKQFGIEEFHLEDLNPTINKTRMKEISEEILRRNVNVQWKIGSGTKIETVDKETLTIMAKAGCTFVSFSPESGSPEMLKKMNKPFDHKLALELVQHMNQLQVITQACFVLGYPEETEKDREMTYDYIQALAKAGCDEVALFIMAPVPGASTYERYKEEITRENKKVELQEMSFSPRWRKDYELYKKMRTKAYLLFGITKLLYHPIKTLKQPLHVITGHFETKMEMTLFRVAKTYMYSFKRKITPHKELLVMAWIVGIFILYYVIRAIDMIRYMQTQ